METGSSVLLLSGVCFDLVESHFWSRPLCEKQRSSNSLNTTLDIFLLFFVLFSASIFLRFFLAWRSVSISLRFFTGAACSAVIYTALLGSLWDVIHGSGQESSS
ncbi:hypothetical protein BC939DRAFT_434512 [Gamsiella multidivaricata]|uniref:uncharacterized protein n=1 Tax=Gamsiella multidivaricata TaxID=101098 RepID=UPI0022209D7B|nr:uncharacterized protein BC939DRAFT_434512 [Gamsiella multidivaricata]KAI7832826.1 hypothetical protein BC939DRAFT_434512 [Gamsiella multidivaricata]